MSDKRTTCNKMEGEPSKVIFFSSTFSCSSFYFIFWFSIPNIIFLDHSYKFYFTDCPTRILLLYFNNLHATVYWGPFEDFSKASSETFQLPRTITNISDHIRKSFPKISEHFPRFPKIFRKC